MNSCRRAIVGASSAYGPTWITSAQLPSSRSSTRTPAGAAARACRTESSPSSCGIGMSSVQVKLPAVGGSYQPFEWRHLHGDAPFPLECKLCAVCGGVERGDCALKHLSTRLPSPSTAKYRLFGTSTSAGDVVTAGIRPSASGARPLPPARAGHRPLPTSGSSRGSRLLGRAGSASRSRPRSAGSRLHRRSSRRRRRR